MENFSDDSAGHHRVPGKHRMGIPFLLTSDVIPANFQRLWEGVERIVPGTLLEREEIRQFIHGEMAPEKVDLFMQFARENPSHLAKVMRARELHILHHGDGPRPEVV